MSYTLTIEAPEKAAWFERQRAKMSDVELGELFVLFLAERVAKSESSHQSLVEIFRECPVDVDFDRLIPPRSERIGRAHPVDFSKLFSEEA